jgi:hypothetical protein
MMRGWFTEDEIIGPFTLKSLGSQIILDGFTRWLEQAAFLLNRYSRIGLISDSSSMLG